MAKVRGSYKSLVRGVSEQVPHDRLDGQHYEQVNMLSDPIRGLVRRRGSRFLDKLATDTPGPDTFESLKHYREHTYAAGGSKYSILYSTKPVQDSPLNKVILYNKDTDSVVPVSMSTLAEARAGEYGISSAVSVGRYILLSLRGRVPEYTSENRVAATSDRASIWIRGGAYSRTYRIRYGTTTVTYTTPKSYYDGVLDTSDIPADASDYTKRVNDRVHAYNTAVNQYIASAQAAIQPEAIAEQLRVRMVAAGFTCTRTGSHLNVSGLNRGNQLTGSDGGDGSFLRVAHRTVPKLDDLTRQHTVGTVIAVELTEDGVYYVEAFPKENSTTGFGEVIWREAAGWSLKPTDVLMIGTVKDGTLYVGATPADLDEHLPDEHGLPVPEFLGRTAGDETTAPTPDFLKRPISYMTVFQDRLVICSGANVFMSVPGDYFNWFRKSALRINPDDPIEVYALGAEDDTIRGGATIDRNLILIGDSLHYAVSGRDAITPNNAIVSVQAAFEDTTDAAPRSLGNLLFYGQHQGGVTKLHQMQVGAFADSFASFSVTQQITKYIDGKPRQLVTSSQPNMVLMSTEGNEYGVYVFTFLDSPDQEERLFDSWSRWQWSEELGRVIGLTDSEEGFVVFTLRECADGWFIVADEFSRDGSLGDAPYLDSLVVLPEEDGWACPVDMSNVFAVVSATHQRRLYGQPYEDLDRVLDQSGVAPGDVWLGIGFDSYYEPTAPYLRDRQDAAILSGRTVLTNLGITLERSAGIKVALAGRGGDFDAVLLDDTGFRINDPLSPLGSVPLTDRRVTCFAGREIREHRLRISAKSWTPLNVATVEWTIQTFNRR